MNFSMRKAVARACGIAAATFAAGATAADDVGKMYLNPQYGYTWLDSSRAMNDGDHLALGIGWHLTDLLSVEVNGLKGEFDSDLARQLEQTVYSLDYLLVFNRESRVSPYITLGGGYVENRYDTDFDEYGPLAQAGFGLLLDFGGSSTRNFVFQIRPEVKYRFDWADGLVEDTHGDLLINLGFAFNFGASASAPPVVQAPPPPPPPPAPAPAPPPGPVDSDRDGVFDSDDRCPATPLGMAVDGTGCPRKDPVVLRGVGFATNSATLTAASLPVLDGVAQDLRKYPRLRVELQGHTDSSGADAYNLDLSQRRADAVRNYLVSQGVSGTQLEARGLGESEPIADNGTPEGRADNRRVVMRVLANPGNAPVQGETD
jgi:OOP family OmpA-OmpF porin